MCQKVEQKLLWCKITEVENEYLRRIHFFLNSLCQRLFFGYKVIGNYIYNCSKYQQDKTGLDYFARFSRFYYYYAICESAARAPI